MSPWWQPATQQAERVISLAQAVDGLRHGLQERSEKAFEDFVDSCEHVGRAELGVSGEDLDAIVDKSIHDLWGIIRSQDYSSDWVAKQLRADLRYQIEAAERQGGEVEQRERTSLAREEALYKVRKGEGLGLLIKETRAVLGPRKQPVSRSKSKTFGKWLRRILPVRGANPGILRR